MYVGHFAIALAAKRCRPTLPLAVCLIAATAPDLMMAAASIVFDGARVDAYSHSLFSIAALSVVGGALTWFYLANTRDALWASALVATHLPADWLTSRLALWPHGPVWGLGLYARPGVDLILESALAIAGWVIYRRGLPRALMTRALSWAPLGVMLFLQGVWDGMHWR